MGGHPRLTTVHPSLGRISKSLALGGFVEAVLDFEEDFGRDDVSYYFCAGLGRNGVQDVVELMQHVEARDA